jgi:hypothetical protein
VYREPHPARTGAVFAGAGAAACWLLLFGLLGSGLPSRVWWVLAAGCASWLVALALARFGDRGVAAGVALATGLGWAVAGGVVALYWVVTTDWPLW